MNTQAPTEMWKEFERITLAEARERKLPAADAVWEGDEDKVAFLWIDKATDWHFEEGHDGKFCATAMNDSVLVDTPEAAMEWLRENYFA